MSPVLLEVLSPILDDQVATNKQRASRIVGGFVLVVAAVLSVIGLLIGAGPSSILIALIMAGGLAFAACAKSSALVLSGSGAQPADPVAHARLHNLVEGLCITAGVPKPGVYLIDDAAPNAFAVGRSPRQAAVVVTRGLTEKLNRIELEGVLAHELSRVKNHDVVVSTLAATLLGPLVRIMPAPAGARLVQRAVGTHGQELADLTAVSFTRYPPGLIAALEKLRGAHTAVRSASRATAHLWLAPALAGGAGGDLAIHPSLEERIAALQEL
ncbi:MAG TPA: M48 family metalloprotease [Acidimicrobiales bacterium]|nr:M48 family metalloprotease [Acidimicrobiales bacterium]